MTPRPFHYGRILVLSGADKCTSIRPSTCGNCPNLYELHDLRGNERDSAHDHRKGRHRAWRAVITAGRGARADLEKAGELAVSVGWPLARYSWLVPVSCRQRAELVLTPKRLGIGNERLEARPLGEQQNWWLLDSARLLVVRFDRGGHRMENELGTDPMTVYGIGGDRADLAFHRCGARVRAAAQERLRQIRRASRA